MTRSAPAILLAWFLVATLVVGAGAMPVVTGELVINPPQVPPSVGGGSSLPPGSLDCAHRVTLSACARQPICIWTDDGSCVHAGLDQWFKDNPPQPIGKVPVRVSVEGITADTTFDAALFIGTGSAPAVVLTFPAGTGRVELSTHNLLFGPSGALVRLCLNTTPCDGWPQECAACVERPVEIDEQSPDPSPGPDGTRPKVRLHAPFSPEPSWALEVIRAVEAHVEVLEQGSTWTGRCTLRRVGAPDAFEVCLTGELNVDPCPPLKATGPNGTVHNIRFTGDDVGGWSEGSYELWCTVIDGSENEDTMAEVFKLVGIPGPSEVDGPEATPIRLPASCGDGVCWSGEDMGSCCQDCGCPVGRECVDGSCTSLRRGRTLVLYLVAGTVLAVSWLALRKRR